MLPTIVRRKNYVTPSSLLDELFSDSFLPKSSSWNYYNGDKTPAVNVEETDKEYRIELAAPGLDKEDFKVSVNDGVLTISSEKNSENKEDNENYIRREFGYSSFCRSFTLPDKVNADKINAKHKNGILSVSVPKTEPKVFPVKEIKVF
ncbi:MAG: Hsp20/alpha crystallin family protein [Bacteroidales bacterium]|nr:Hsp20/alpha crystallin family protein [Bacteroidales bacterium]